MQSHGSVQRNDSVILLGLVCRRYYRVSGELVTGSSRAQTFVSPSTKQTKTTFFTEYSYYSMALSKQETTVISTVRDMK